MLTHPHNSHRDGQTHSPFCSPRSRGHRKWAYIATAAPVVSIKTGCRKFPLLMGQIIQTCEVFFHVYIYIHTHQVCLPDSKLKLRSCTVYSFESTTGTLFACHIYLRTVPEGLGSHCKGTSAGRLTSVQLRP